MSKRKGILHYFFFVSLFVCFFSFSFSFWFFWKKKFTKSVTSSPLAVAWYTGWSCNCDHKFKLLNGVTNVPYVWSQKIRRVPFCSLFFFFKAHLLIEDIVFHLHGQVFFSCTISRGRANVEERDQENEGVYRCNEHGHKTAADPEESLVQKTPRKGTWAMTVLIK